MLKIRLRRMGSRHQPFYRIVVSDSRQTPFAAAVEEIGYYDPRQDPATIAIDTERVDYWTGVGAQLSGAVRKLVKQAKASPAVAETTAEQAPEVAAEQAPEVVEKKTAPETAAEEKAPEAAAGEQTATDGGTAEEPASEEKTAPDAAEATPA